jgi:DNA-binding XRE family transcriptional regulator
MMQAKDITPELIREYRDKYKVKFYMMANSIGISNTAFSANLRHMEKGVPVFRFCDRMAEYFNRKEITITDIEGEK